MAIDPGIKDLYICLLKLDCFVTRLVVLPLFYEISVKQFFEPNDYGCDAYHAIKWPLQRTIYIRSGANE